MNISDKVLKAGFDRFFFFLRGKGDTELFYLAFWGVGILFY